MANLRRPTALCLLLLCLGGCTRHYFHKSADKEVNSILHEKDRYSDWALEQYHVDPDPRARFADDGNPDRPPMPPDDPAAHDLSPNPQHPPKKQGIRLMEGEGYIDIMTEWDALNRAGRKTDENKKNEKAEKEKEEKQPKPPSYDEATSPYRDPLISKESPRTFLLNLDQSIQLALFNSREFQDRREDLYLTALPVTTERFAFSAQFFATEQLIRERLGRDFPGGPANRWVSKSTFGVSKLLATGAMLLFQFANRTVVEMANKSVPRVISESTINFDAIQPLLRGGGYAVTLEPLTLVERNLLYEIRDFARFRKQFYVAIAAGFDIGATSVGATRFRNRPAVFNLNQYLPGGQVLPRNGVLFNLNSSGNAPTAGYLPVVLNQTLLVNERNNVTKLEEILRLFQALFDANLVEQKLQIDRVEQQLLQGRSSSYQRDQTLRDSLDQFKLQLGIPTNMPLELDDQPVVSQSKQLRLFEQIIDDYQQLYERAAKLIELPDLTQLRVEFHRLASASRLVQGTEFRTRFLRRWLQLHQTIPPQPDRQTRALADQLRRIKEQLETAKNEQKELDKKEETIPAKLLDRIKELTFESDVLSFELNLRGCEEELLRQETLRAATITGTLAGLTAMPGLAVLGPRAPEVSTKFLAAFTGAITDFETGMLIAVRNERLEKVRKLWTELPRICVEGVDLMTADLEQAEAVVARTAIGHRFDLMNARAQLVDSWRQIAVAANSLLGTFNIEYHLTSITPPGLDRPFAFSGSRSRNQLIFNGELPLVRIVERNNYRASLISWQRQRRTLMATEDTIVFNVRSELRQLRVLAENYRISQRAVELAYLQVESALEIVRKPSLPNAPPPDLSSQTQQLLEAQRNVITAQNQLVNLWVQYLTTRMQLYRDLELMPLDPHGAWIDDVATCHCPDSSSPRESNGQGPAMRMPRPPARWNPRKRLLFGLGLAVALATVIALLWWLLHGRASNRPDLIIHVVKRGPIVQTIVERGELQSAANHDVYCTVNHEALCAAKTSIKSVVDDGKPVKKGEQLMQLDDARLRDLLGTQAITRDKAQNDFVFAKANLQIVSKQGSTDLATSQRALELAEKALEKYRDGDYPQALSDVVSRIEIARGDLEQYRDNAAYYERLVRKKFVSATQLRAAELKLLGGIESLKKVEGEKKVLVEFTYPQTMKELGGKVEDARATLDRFRIQAAAQKEQAENDLATKELIYNDARKKYEEIEREIKKCDILAPVDGLVVYFQSQQSRRGSGGTQTIVAEGEQVYLGQKLMQIPDLKRMVVNTRIHEALFSKVSEGLRARIRPHAFHQRELQGKVRKVANVAVQQDWFSGDVKVYEAEVEIEDDISLLNLKPGMSAEVIIETRERAEDVLTVPVQAVVRIPGEKVRHKVYVKKEDAIEAREVTVGISTESMVVIATGLDEGEQVVLNVDVLGLDKKNNDGDGKDDRKGKDKKREGAGGTTPPQGGQKDKR